MKISRALLHRLPIYLNYLKAYSYDRISSRELAQALGLGEVLVRKDLATVSNGGRRRIGHYCKQLIDDIEQFLNLQNITDAVLVGAGKLGQALIDYTGFEKSGLNIISAFDITPETKRTAGGKPIYPISRLNSFCRRNNIRMGIIAVPPDQAQVVCYALVDAGILAIWNFAPIHLDAPENILIQNENLAASLASLRISLEPVLLSKPGVLP